MRRWAFALAGLFFSFAGANAQVKVLFDATKGEMAGNADWVIDYDTANLGVNSGGTYRGGSSQKSNPQRIPTPPQSGITASTPETYWKGGISSWGVDCAKRGFTVESLPWNAKITYGDASNVQDLSRYDVYIVDEPNFQFSPTEKNAIVNFVKNGGGLFMVGNHAGNDRNFDGWDSRQAWNDLMKNNTVQTDPFGVTFDSAYFDGISTVISAASTDSIVYGPMGAVAKVEWAGGTSMTLNPAKNSTVKGVVYKKGTTPGNNNALVAYCRFGAGRVVMIGDSSPTDDSTGNETCTLYNGYWKDADGNHRLLLMNATIWLAKANTTGVLDVADGGLPVVYPNPSDGQVNVRISRPGHTSVTISDITGKTVASANLDNGSHEATFTLQPGTYIVRMTNAGKVEVTKAVIR